MCSIAMMVMEINRVFIQQTFNERHFISGKILDGLIGYINDGFCFGGAHSLMRNQIMNQYTLE